VRPSGAIYSSVRRLGSAHARGTISATRKSSRGVLRPLPLQALHRIWRHGRRFPNKERSPSRAASWRRRAQPLLLNATSQTSLQSRGIQPIKHVRSAVDLKYYGSAARSSMNFKSKNHVRVVNLPVPLSIPKFTRSVPQRVANFGIGTLAVLALRSRANVSRFASKTPHENVGGIPIQRFSHTARL
jgi:hypothetical protein